MTDIERAKKVAKIWEGDALNRSRDAEILRTFTTGHLDLRENAGEARTYVLNLDANWGAGKSFFLNRFKEHLEAYGHLAVYVNAWENDHSDDPFMTVIDEIQTELANRIGAASGHKLALEKTGPLRKSAAKIIGGAVYSGGKHLITKYIGDEAADGLRELISGDGADSPEDDGEHGKLFAEAMQKTITSAVDAAGEEVLAQFRQQKEVQKNFQIQLKELGREVLKQEGINAPIFILIDELDRCRPSYAIELLERVKHIFSLENFVYILGTDTQQLANAIKGVYGSEFDGERYLRRFVDRTYHFQETPKDKLIHFALSRNGLRDEDFETLDGFDAITFLSKALGEANTEPRDIRQIIEIIGTFAAAMPINTRKIDLVSLLPLVYQRHFNLSDLDLNECDLAKIRFHFVTWSGQSERAPIEKKYSEVWKFVSRHSIDTHRLKEPRSSLEQWIQTKNLAELKEIHRATGDRRRQQPVREEYALLLDQVSNITGSSDDTGDDATDVS